MNDQRTIATLYKQFEELYTPNQISNSLPLMTLYGYLSAMKKRANGDYYHGNPDPQISSLIAAFLRDGSRSKIIAEARAEAYAPPVKNMPDCRFCNFIS